MPLQSTSGAASYDAFGGGAASEPVYIEDAFSCFLYSGTSSTQTITNGIDLAGDGGLVWTKMRNTGSFGNSDHWLFDTARGVEKKLSTNTTSSQGATSGALQQFNANGYQLGYTGGGYYELNYTGNTYVSWTLKKQPKFFDVVTYSGNSSSSQVISHNLGSVPGCMIIRPINAVGDWPVYHRSMGNTSTMWLNQTGGINTQLKWWNNTSPTDTQFTVGNDSDVNASGRTYVAYLFAHDAGGFGLTGTDNVISCGSYTGNGSADGPTVTLGYEPQWLMVKSSSDPYAWVIFDNMRGMDYTGSPRLFPNLSNAESAMSPGVVPTATGFKINTTNATVNDASGVTYIYIAIRRGPMKVPTSGTEVYGQQLNVALPTFSFPPDMVLELSRASDPTYGQWVSDRLRGSNQILQTFSTNAESSGSPFAAFNQGGKQTTWGDGWSSGYIVNGFRRAPSFFDEVCYTGTGSNQTLTHNLTVAPELMIIKRRDTTGDWWVVDVTGSKQLNLNQNYDAASLTTTLVPSSPTSTTFSVGTYSQVNGSGNTFVAYLFATCAGVSKVGSYTGTGTTKQVDCGFTGGARFVLIKKTSGTGSWYVWDSARGIVSGNDPYLLLNSTAAEVTSTDYIDTYSAGFEISSTAPSEINENGGSFIFLAIS